MKKLLTISLFLVLGALLSAQAYSKEPLGLINNKHTPMPLIPLTQGFETDSIQLSRGLDGKVKHIEARSCLTCDFEKYTINLNTQIYIGKDKVTLDDLTLTQYNGKSGAVSYYPQTKELHHILFFNLEEEQ